jgi:hypothetical protein
VPVHIEHLVERVLVMVELGEVEAILLAHSDLKLVFAVGARHASSFLLIEALLPLGSGH